MAVDVQKLLLALQQVNATIAKFEPTYGALLQAGVTIVAAIRGSGTDIKPFAEEIAKFDAYASGGIGTDDRWRADHGLPPWKGGTAPLPPNVG